MDGAAEMELAVPPMSAAKHNRIDIWRNEVAALALDTSLDAGDDPQAQPPSPLSATSSASSSSLLSLPPSRTRRLWRRLSHRITGRPRLDLPAPDVIRTDMYRGERQQQQQQQQQQGANSKQQQQQRRPVSALVDQPADDSSGSGLKGALGQKQDRLERAARLLEHGPAHAG